jgi:histidinol-phosphate aminotransferase
MKPKFNRFFRKSILELNPYKSAREEYKNEGREMILLDANENPFQSSFNRYPDPMQVDLKSKIASWKNVRSDQLYLSNGSDEFISQIIIAFCEPGEDHIMIVPPTFGMYKVSALTYGVEVKEIPLILNFQLDTNAILQAANEKSKIIFIPTPNNPTANSFDAEAIEIIIKNFFGLVVLDEAYIEFTDNPSFIEMLEKYSNLIVCQTFSKAQGMAGARLGMAFAHPELISYINRVKAPYNLNSLTINAAIKRLNEQDQVQNQVDFMIKERKRIISDLNQINFIKTIYPSDANFIMVLVDNSSLRYKQLLDHNIVVRNSSKNFGCENTLRISLGLKKENDALIKALYNIENQ